MMFFIDVLKKGKYKVLKAEWYEIPLRLLMWIYGYNLYIMPDYVTHITIHKEGRYN